MDVIFQICALAFTAAFLCVLLRHLGSVHSLLLSLGAAVLILLMCLQFLKPVFDLLRQLRTMTNLEDPITMPMMKIVGIGIVSQIADDICCDAGEKALGKAVEISATILSVYSALPLLSSILDLLQSALRSTT